MKLNEYVRLGFCSSRTVKLLFVIHVRYERINSFFSSDLKSNLSVHGVKFIDTTLQRLQSPSSTSKELITQNLITTLCQLQTNKIGGLEMVGFKLYMVNIMPMDSKICFKFRLNESKNQKKKSRDPLIFEFIVN